MVGGGGGGRVGVRSGLSFQSTGTTLANHFYLGLEGRNKRNPAKIGMCPPGVLNPLYKRCLLHTSIPDTGFFSFMVLNVHGGDTDNERTYIYMLTTETNHLRKRNTKTGGVK